MRFPAELLACALATSLATAQVETRVVVRSGAPAPGTPGLTFLDISDPRVGESGDIAFWSRVAGAGATSSNDTGYWLDQNGAITPVYRAGFSVPGVSNSTVPYLGAMSFNVGRFAFGAPIIPPQVPTQPQTNWSYLTDVGGTGLLLLARDPSGLTKLNARVLLTSSGATAWTNDDGVWYNGVLIAGLATPAPGDPGFTLARFNEPAVNASGQFVFRAVARLSPTERPNAYYALVGGSLQRLVGVNDPAPGTSFLFRDIAATPAMNSLGTIAFTGATNAAAPAGPGVWSTRSGTLAADALAGELAPGVTPDARYLRFGPVVLAANGVMAFRAGFAPAPTDSNAAIFRTARGLPFAAVIEGQQAPGLPAGVTLGQIGDPQISPTGRIAFLARLAGAGVFQTNAQALFAQRAGGTFTPIVRLGDVIQVGGTPRTVRAISFDSEGPDTGWSAFNSAGAMAYKVQFTDNSSALLVTRVGCPADFNDDDAVDFNDYLAFLNFFNTDDPAADLNQDGAVDFNDYLAFLNLFNAQC